MGAPDLQLHVKDSSMDSIQPPIYPRPLVPIGPRETRQGAPHKLKGKIVGVRSGRSGEIGTTQILTIKIVTPSSETSRLLHAEIEIILPPK